VASLDVIRDRLGVPHVRARSIDDAFFAQGFVHAQDRLWQMEYDRYRAAGRLSELIGASGLAYDVFVRRMRILDASRADYEALGPEARAMLDAYAAGVNAFLDGARALPVEFELLGATPEPWRGWDAAATMKVRHVLMGSMHAKVWRALLLRTLGPDAVVRIGSVDGRDETLIVPVDGRETWHARAADVEPGLLAVAALEDGSNNWVVHGSRTRSGLPLMAGDPHRILEAPNVYYQNHIACPEFDASGFSVPGIPGIFHFGHTQHVAWCITHAMADTQDLFVERFDAALRHERAGEWLASDRRTETIQVRGGAPVTIDALATPSGPVVFGDPAAGAAIAMRWTGIDAPNRTFDAFVPMLRARTVDELDEAMRPWVDPCNSMLMAGVDGAIAYLHRGRVPERTRANAWVPVPAWTGEHDWRGDVPFEALPRLRNPDRGFVVTANNRVVGDDFPHYLGMDYSAPNRARRILDRLDSLEGATAEDMAAIHADRLSLPSRMFADLASRAPARGVAARARALLESWDGRMEAGDAAPAVYAVMRDELAGVLMERDPLARLDPSLLAEEPYPTPLRARVRTALPRLIAAGDATYLGGDSWATVTGEALERAVAFLSERLGADPESWRWGDLHTTRTLHPLARVFPDAAATLNPPPVSVGGDGDTVNVAAAEAGFHALHSSVARYVFDLGDWSSSAWVVPLGSSGDPASPHYADQAGTWARVEMTPMAYDWVAIEAESESRQAIEAR